jgi:hypothetical protein
MPLASAAGVPHSMLISCIDARIHVQPERTLNLIVQLPAVYFVLNVGGYVIGEC